MDDFSLLVVTSQISGQALYLGGAGRGPALEPPLIPPGVLHQNCGGYEPNRTVTRIVLKATHLALRHDKFRGP
ncbi:hypothetical protein TNCV_353281 [Trichonephila clavipes]|nr:hypothetical protein TNCV_353281 [Trichonephila clavipes]